MKTEKMLEIASELNRCLAYSDIEGSVEFGTDDNNRTHINFIHYDKRYKHNNGILFIYSWLDDGIINNLVDKVKNVIAGEELIND
ncbi:hypothetical protein KM149_06965 [Staphylococcus coagulans]|uniref:hypothetical protein n=1 Tax=Staphylococcus coagulans TaxID=74706 RepID=UPI001F4C5097|nr:hypothetical protein [Staphylococcus coagulans]UNB47636.1 hypothetical protein KM149_06965 [Staphylococcus coagulans]